MSSYGGSRPIRRDEGDDQPISPVGYIPGRVIEGQFVPGTEPARTLPGSRRALFVEPALEEPQIELLNPAGGAAVPALVALTRSGRLFETWAVDLRDPTTNPPLIYLQIFDAAAVPAAGTAPLVSALPLCRTAAYAWPDEDFHLEVGLVVALSSTALTYTPLAANQLFSITARVLEDES